jgi:hypothetical protein
MDQATQRLAMTGERLQWARNLSQPVAVSGHVKLKKGETKTSKVKGLLIITNLSTAHRHSGD